MNGTCRDCGKRDVRGGRGAKYCAECRERRMRAGARKTMADKRKKMTKQACKTSTNG